MNANIRTIGGSLGAAIMSSIVTAGTRTGALPHNSGYTHGFLALTVAALAAAAASLLVPRLRRPASVPVTPETMPHAELGLLAAGTLFGDAPE